MRLAAATRWRRSGGIPAALLTCLCPQCWENGIILCRELADQYESYYDYRNLSKMRVGCSRLGGGGNRSDVVLSDVSR